MIVWLGKIWLGEMFCLVQVEGQVVDCVDGDGFVVFDVRFEDGVYYGVVGGIVQV